MAEIAVALEQALARRTARGAPGETAARTLARGDGWRVDDVVCTSGPEDRPFEEQHTEASISFVAAGSFQYRSTTGRELMTPGSLVLGDAGQRFECGHEHARGDRCLSFRYSPEYFARVAGDAGARRPALGALRVPPLRALSRLLARAGAGLAGADVAWEELGLELLARTVRLVNGLPEEAGVAPLAAEARVTRALRMIERRVDAMPTLGELAREAGLSPYHFLRTFERLTGLTPHQYVRRARLRQAAVRLVTGRNKVLDVALDCGFGDVSNFNRAFRAEFGTSPRAYRKGGERA